MACLHPTAHTIPQALTLSIFLIEDKAMSLKKLKKLKPSEIALIIASLFVLTIVVLSLVQVPVSANWKTEGKGEGLTLTVTGSSMLIGADGQPIQIALITKVATLSFIYQEKEVTALRVQASWQVEGEDIDWDTLQIVFTASGTGGYSDRQTYATKSGTALFTLPISVTQLGYTPTEGETIEWSLTIHASATALKEDGTEATAEAGPITSKVATTWTAGQMEYEESPPDEEETETPSGDEGTTGGSNYYVGGGCGPPGYHVVWAYGVEPNDPVNAWLPYIKAIFGIEIMALLTVAYFLIGDYTTRTEK